jgi:hypothetical protein
VRALTSTGRGVLAALALVASGAADAPLATAASAAAPEFGRCVKVTPGTGVFKSANCGARAAAGRGEYEWLPGPGPHRGLSANWGYNFVPEAILYSSQVRVYCLYNLATGEFTGPKTLKMTMYLWQCRRVPNKLEAKNWCQEVGAGNRPESEIGEIKAELTGKLGFIEGTKEVGIEYRPALGSRLTIFECGGANETTGAGGVGTGTGTLYGLEGGLVAHIPGTVRETTRQAGTYNDLNAMVPEYRTQFRVRKGRQSPERLAGEPADTLTLVTPPVGLQATKEAALFTGEEEVDGLEEEIEINTRA